MLYSRFKFATRHLSTILEPDLCDLRVNPCVKYLETSTRRQASTVLTCTSFSPSATRFTISILEALSGFEFRSYSASRMAWSSGLMVIIQHCSLPRVYTATLTLYAVVFDGPDVDYRFLEVNSGPESLGNGQGRHKSSPRTQGLYEPCRPRMTGLKEHCRCPSSPPCKVGVMIYSTICDSRA